MVTLPYRVSGVVPDFKEPLEGSYKSSNDGSTAKRRENGDTQRNPPVEMGLTGGGERWNLRVGFTVEETLCKVLGGHVTTTNLEKALCNRSPSVLSHH